MFFAGCAASLYLLSRRLLGQAAGLGPILCLLAFMLHPSMVEVVPVPPRRPEMMACMLMALSIWLQLSPKRMAARRLVIAPAALATLAMASKETAFALPALSAMAVLLYSPRPGLRAWLGHVVTAIVPHVIALVVMLSARVAVFGGIGGYAHGSIGTTIAKAPKAFALLSARLLFPMEMVRPTGWVLGLVGLGVVFVAATCIAMLIKQLPKGGENDPPPRVVAAMALALVWTALMLAMPCAAGASMPWYLLLPTGGFALLVGAIIQWLWTVVRQESTASRPVRHAAIVSGFLVVALLAWQARYSPVLYHYTEWEYATEVSGAVLDELNRLDTAPDGVVIHAPPLLRFVKPRANEPAVRSASMLSDYSVQAWADLMFPHRRIHVVTDPGSVQPERDGIVLHITHRTSWRIRQPVISPNTAG